MYKSLLSADNEDLDFHSYNTAVNKPIIIIASFIGKPCLFFVT